MKNLVLVSCFVLFPIIFHQPCESAKILGAFPFPGKSHAIMYNEIVKELVARGHEVTMITNFPLANMPANYTEILISPSFDFWKDAVKTENIFELSSMTFHQMLQLLFAIGTTTAEHALQRKEIQHFLQHNTDNFDLILTEQFYQEAFLMLVHKYNAPIVTVGTFGFGVYMSPMMGNISPLSHVPHEYLQYNDRMSFSERIHNTLATFYEYLWREYSYKPHMFAIAKKYFPNLPDPVPTIDELERKVSLILLNSYIPLTTVRPTLPNMVQVGGLHIRKPKPLPADMQKFLDEARDGVIYFSLGTNLRSADIHADKMDAILRTFAGMKQKVLWKFENENIPNLPKNIMVKKWMPQNDILAHKNVKVFITHGGLLGTQEGVYHGIPMLGIPVYGDQFLNINKAREAGYAVQLFYPNITYTSFKWALDELLYKSSYSTTMRKVSKQFRDRPVEPLTESIFWIEYVIEHKGAEHLQSAARDISWFIHMGYDVLLFLIFAPFGLVYILIKLCGCICCSSTKKKDKMKNNKKHN